MSFVVKDFGSPDHQITRSRAITRSFLALLLVFLRVPSCPLWLKVLFPSITRSPDHQITRSRAITRSFLALFLFFLRVP
jgi:hypothetical protein